MSFDPSMFVVSTLQEWFTVYEHNRRPNCTVSDLVIGNEYRFRVYSENLCGMSDEPGHSKNTAIISKAGVCACVWPYRYDECAKCILYQVMSSIMCHIS